LLQHQNAISERKSVASGITLSSVEKNVTIA